MTLSCFGHYNRSFLLFLLERVSEVQVVKIAVVYVDNKFY